MSAPSNLAASLPPVTPHDSGAGRSAVLRCAGTADLLAALPFLTGFTAENSLFIVLFSGSRGGDAVRIDLPPKQAPEVTGPLLDAVCRMLREIGAGAEGPAIVITSARGFADSGGVPWLPFARLLEQRFEREGWWLRDLAVLAPDGWTGLLGDRAGERRPLSEIEASPVAAEAVEVAPPPRPFEELGALPDPNPRRAAAIASHLTELDGRAEEQTARPAGDDDGRGTPIWVHGAARMAGACFSMVDEPPEPRLCARLILAAEDPDRWLVLALTALTRAEFVIDAAGRRETDGFIGLPVGAEDDSGRGSETGWSIRLLLLSLANEVPEPAKLRRAILVLSDVAAHAPVGRRPGILALLAWAWWMLGMQSVSQRVAEQALAIDADHPLTRMACRLNEAPPPWPLRGFGRAER